MQSHEEALAALRKQIELKLGQPVRTPKDFDRLSASIAEQLHEPISTSTLKRVWNYMPGYLSARTSTLDILARYVGHDSWTEFLVSLANAPVELDQPSRKRFPNYGLILMAGVVLIVLAVSVFAWGRTTEVEQPSSPFVLTVGQSFSGPDEYLRLFGIDPKSCKKFWDVKLPNSERTFICGHTFHHPVWHNDGNPDSLMPTITEYKTSGSADEQRVYNYERHVELVRNGAELRIMFMKNVVDTNYTYLGIYRSDLEHSDTTKIVWKRIIRDCDLGRLDFLNKAH